MRTILTKPFPSLRLALESAAMNPPYATVPVDRYERRTPPKCPLCEMEEARELEVSLFGLLAVERNP